MKAAQIAYVTLTVLFLATALVLFVSEYAIVAAAICLFVAVFGFIVFTTMLMSDAGLTKPRE